MGLVVLIDRPGYRLVADRKVIKRDEASIVENVERAYELAQQQIAGAFQQAEDACDRIAAEAYEKGMAAARDEAAQRLAIAELDRHALLNSLRPALAELIVEAVTLIAKDLDRRALLARAFEQLHTSFSDVSWARVRVHPEAADAARAALDELCSETGVGKLARVMPDETLPRDACLFESELGVVDASLDTQLQAIRAAIVQATQRLSVATTD
jgi:type III secretion protein L